MSWDAPYPDWPLPQRNAGNSLPQLFTQDADTFGGDAVQQNNALTNFIAPTYETARAPDDGIITDSFDLANLFKSGAEPAPVAQNINANQQIGGGEPFNPTSGIATEEPMDLASLFKSLAEPAPTVPDANPKAPGNQFMQEAAQQPKTNYIDALSKQILGQGHTDKWTGAGFGSAEANARDMARILDSIGVTDIKQFGLIDKPYDAQVNPDGRGGYVDMQGKPVDPKKVTAQDVSGESGTETVYTAPTTTKVYGNKVTGQEVPMTYSERQTGNAWGGTFEGAGNTGYRVQFDEQGNPYFYTTGASSNNMAQFAPLLAMASFIPGVAPFAQGLNALMAAKSGNVLGAVGSLAGLGDYAGIGGMGDIANAAKFANAAQNKDILGMLGSGSGLAGVGDIGGVNIKDITKGIGTARALQSGDPLAIMRAASGYMGGSGEGPSSDDFIEGYFQPGGEGYIDPNKEEQTVNQNPDESSELTKMLSPYLSGQQPTKEEETDWASLYNTGLSDEEIAKREALMKSLPNQEIEVTPENWDSYNKTLTNIINNKGGFTSQWQTSGSDRIMINDDGTGIGINTETGESYSLDPDEVNTMIKNGQLNTKESGYVGATGGTGGLPGGSNRAPQAKSTATKTTSTKAPASTPAKTATAQPTQDAQNNAQLAALLAMMGDKGDVAHIKSYKELFGEDLFGESYVPPSARDIDDGSGYVPEITADSGDQGEELYRGGHVDDIDVNTLLQILRG